MATVIVPIRAKDETKKGIDQVESRFSGLRSTLGSAVGVLGITAGIGGAVAALQAGVDAAAGFETALTNITARVELTDSELENVRQTALDLGRDTKFTASQAAEGMLELITSGSTAAEALETIPHVLDLAAASGDALGQTADAVTDIMAQFGLETSEAEAVVNTLTAAAGSSSATVSDLAQGMANAGAVASSYGIDLDDTSAALAVLAENGIKGAEGGTALRSAILNATRVTGPTIAAWDELGTSWFDAEGNARPLDDIIKDLNVRLADKTPEDANRLMKDLFGSYGITAANALLAADGIDDMKESMAGQRTASEVAAEQMQTFQARMDSFGSTMETLAIKVLTPFLQNVLTPMIVLITDIVNAFAAWIDSAEAAAVFEVVQTIIQNLLANLQNLITFVKSVLVGDWETAFASLQAIVQNAFNIIQGVPLIAVGTILSTFGEFFAALIGGAVGGLDKIVIAFQTAFNHVRAFIHNTVLDILTIVENLLNSILKGIEQFIRGALQPVADQAGTIFDVGGLATKAKEFLQGFDLTVDFTSNLGRVSASDFGTPGLGIDIGSLQAGLASTLTGTGQQLVQQGQTLISQPPVTVNIRADNLIGDERAIARQVNELVRRNVVRIG